MVERNNLHCDVVHISTVWVSNLTIDCNGVFAIKAYTMRHANVTFFVIKMHALSLSTRMQLFW